MAFPSNPSNNQQATINNTVYTFDSASGSWTAAVTGQGPSNNVITSTTESTSTATGALQVSGGAGISKSIFVGGLANVTGTVYLSNTSPASSLVSGALQVAGGAAITGAFYSGGTASIGASSANYLTVAGTTAGNNPVIAPVGSDTNIGMSISPKGTGNVALNSNTTVTGNLSITYNPSSVIGAALFATGKDTLGGTGYFDFLKATNTTSGATNPNKFMRLNSTGELQIINSLYTSQLMVLTDAGDLTILGNVTSSGSKSGYSSGRPGFRVYGSTNSSFSTTTNTYGYFNSSQWTVDFNQGSYLNSTTGLFTAPVAGLYQINLTSRNAGNVAYSQLAVVKNVGANYTNGSVMVMIEYAGSSTMNHVGGSTTTQMAVGDTLCVKVLAGTIQFDSNDQWSVAYLG